MKRILSCAVFLLVSQGFVSNAKSETHERVTITPWKSGGKTIGFNLTLVIRPTYYTQVKVGLGDPGRAPFGGDWRNVAAGNHGSYILHKLGFVKGVQRSHNQTVKFKVKFSDVPKLKPGAHIEVVTAWDKGYWHIHGATTPLYRNSDSYKLPDAKVAKRAKKKKKAQPRAKKKTKTAKRRVAKKKPAKAKRSKVKKKTKTTKRRVAKKKKKPATAKRSKAKKKPAAKKSKSTRLSKLGGKSKASKASKSKAVKRAPAKPKKAKRVARRRGR